MQIKTFNLAQKSLSQCKNNSVDVFLISTNFQPIEKYDYSILDLNDDSNSKRLRNTELVLNTGFRILKEGGLLFVYGLPKWLPHFAVYLDSLEDHNSRMIFKYWIVLDFDKKPRKETLPPTHTGLLMYLKSRKGKSATSFHLNTKTIRIPYTICKACGRYTKDWGGKKHLMNPLGANVSDVWRHLPQIDLKDNVIPKNILEWVYRLVDKESINFLHVIANIDTYNKAEISGKGSISKKLEGSYNSLNRDVVLHGNSLAYMRRILKLHPNGIFDLVFADPPYNLEKGYTCYKDAFSDKQYIQWSKKWLDLMSKVVRPGGALFVLNLPKYCTHYANFLNQKMNFRHWIGWESMSTPSGKIMPAHYSLLYYTKPGGRITFNYLSKNSSDSNILSPIDADYYCLHSNCIKKRKKLGDDDKIDLKDVWWNIHRIRHKRYRDQHPCQLPIKLMERIIELTTNRGDIVFDPFCGTGTTAIAAKKIGRHYVTLDIDEKYVNLTKRNLERMQPTLTGNYYLPRERKKYERRRITKKEVEIGYIELCKDKGGVVEIEDIEELDSTLFEKIKNVYKNFKRLKKMANRRLEIESLI